MSIKQPNIVLIMTDQQRFDSISALGFPYADTPNLDRLVHEGVNLSQCYITAPSCAPARASLFTGYYPHTTGILKNADRWTRSWVERLSNVGYHCVNIGKMHTFPFETPLGFDERYVVENKDRYLEGRYYFDEWDKALQARGLIKQQRELYRQRSDYHERLGAFEWELPEDMHPDVFVGNLAQWWINNYPVTQPLFLQIGFPGPHPPYDPTWEYAQPYMERELPLPVVTEMELANQPAPFLEMRQHNCEVDHDSVVHQLNPTTEQLHRQRAYYLANVTMIDHQIGKILQTLEHQGYLDNSVVIFTSDHGDCLGDHGHSQKWTMYDIITRVPTIVWSPSHFEGGQTIDGLCQQMDLGPAILELAGADVPTTIEAKSILPALAGQKWTAREYVFAEHGKDGILQGTEFMSMVRSQDWKLVHFLDQPDGQLFDLKADPAEINNLWSHSQFSYKRQELLDVLREWRIRSQYETSGWVAEWR
tara:strand:- start:27 stop:1457 length:1431 start_codon:yes stop_codon:yes gene_type:complete